MSGAEAGKDVLWRQASFDAWANTTRRRYLVLTGLVLLLLAATCTFAISVMGPRLVREGNLLWFGAYTQGTIEESAVRRVGSFKGGAPKYDLTIDYRFTTDAGVSLSGRTHRGDIRTPPEFSPGDAVGVFYGRTNPANSVAEYHLRTDVYALLLFLPFLAVVGLGSALWYFFRFWRWIRAKRASRPAAPKTPYKREPTIKRAS